MLAERKEMIPELAGFSKIGAIATPYCPAGATRFPRLSAENGKTPISTSGACGPDDRSLVGREGPNGSLLPVHKHTGSEGCC